MTAAPPIGPLSGVKVVDLTTNIAGPLAARLLAEMGADAIHIEPPWGDDGRNSTTPFLGREGTLYSTCNRSKRGVVIDIKHPEGQEVLRRIPDWEVREDGIERVHSSNVRGFAHLPIEFGR